MDPQNPPTPPSNSPSGVQEPNSTPASDTEAPTLPAAPPFDWPQHRDEATTGADQDASAFDQTHTAVTSQQPAAAPANNAANAVVPTWQSSNGAPTPVFNNFSEQPGRGTKHTWRVAILATAVLVVALAACLVIVSTTGANNYLNKIKPAYAAQANKMAALYSSFGSPTFTSNTTTSDTDKATFAQANVDIKLASTATTALQNANTYTPLPGTTWFGAAKKAARQHAAIKGYAGDSQAFLHEYQMLVAYASGIEQIADQQDSGVVTALQTAGQSRTLGQLHDNCQQASALMTAMINAISALKPPSDLEDYQTTVLKNFNEANDALMGIVAGIANNDLTQLQNSAASLEQAGTTLSNYSPNLSSMLQTNSHIHNLIVKLENEKPLS